MSGLDIILILLIAAVVGLALRRVLMNRRKGKNCGCGCEGCDRCGTQRRKT
jgi:hypothetical protein